MNFTSLTEPGYHLLSGAVRGSQALLLANLQAAAKKPVMYIAANDRDMSAVHQALEFFAPGVSVIAFPAWDCLPYDRVSPNAHILAERLNALTALIHEPPQILLTTLNAVMQKLPPRAVLEKGTFEIKNGTTLQRDALTHYLQQYGYRRVEKAVEPGEYAVRGSIIDIVSPSHVEGTRIDLFGDEIESLKRFDPLTQLSDQAIEVLRLIPTSEVILQENTINRFRIGYRDAFGAVTREDPLYEAISHGRFYPGMEHWLPLFYDKLDTLFDYLPPSLVMLDHEMEHLRADRLEAIRDYYQARQEIKSNKAIKASPYNPLPPNALYLTEAGWERRLENRPVVQLSIHAQGADDIGFKPIVSITTLKHQFNSAIEAFASQIRPAWDAGKRIILGCYSQGSFERIKGILKEHEIKNQPLISWSERGALAERTVGLGVLPLEQGFETADALIYSEQDVFGERIYQRRPKRKKSDVFMREAEAFQPGELVVHREHGIARFEGLVTLEVNGLKHDCLKLIYDGDDKLFLPVENIELISRFGSEAEGVKLDKLGSVTWQARKAKMKERITDMAHELLKIAAERAVQEAPALTTPQGLYDEFAARFSHVETEDQAKAIEDVIADIQSGKPTDRLICGDVGFGKTEVALRAAFVAVCNATEHGKVQAALICPTTLLSRQHTHTFNKRFDGLPITVRQLSRMTPVKEAEETIQGLADGSVDIVIGTHALLSKKVQFKNLGLMIVDEEQHFGVEQKEKLKNMKADIHVLTLSATPIPRTLQMALSGIRSLSLITTPPVDRLAVRTFVLPFDPMVLRDAILREHHRGGKLFYVTPRIKYIPELERTLRELVPEIKIAVAHGQMAPTKLDKVMNDFYDGKYDLLISTAIIESGLDVPSANTIIVDHSELFGLSQLYQLRGRVGRGKVRAYAYFTLPHHRLISDSATRRLEVMQSLDTLGAGFTVASHDMDIRGYGNLLGEEQSGHIREIGIELYQQMLEEALEAARAGHQRNKATQTEGDWSPQINLGTSVLIPESYVSDLPLRLGLYRRLSDLKTSEAIDSFAAELIDRFGSLPQEVEHLLAVLRIKQLCRQAGIERLDVGAKGAVLSFRHNKFSNPEKLLKFISDNASFIKLRGDHKLILSREWEDMEKKLSGVKSSLAEIAKLAA